MQSLSSWCSKSSKGRESEGSVFSVVLFHVLYAWCTFTIQFGWVVSPGHAFHGFLSDMSKQHGVLLRCTLEVQLMGSDLDFISNLKCFRHDYYRKIVMTRNFNSIKPDRTDGAAQP